MNTAVARYEPRVLSVQPDPRPPVGGIGFVINIQLVLVLPPEMLEAQDEANRIARARLRVEQERLKAERDKTAVLERIGDRLDGIYWAQ